VIKNTPYKALLSQPFFCSCLLEKFSWWWTTNQTPLSKHRAKCSNCDKELCTSPNWPLRNSERWWGQVRFLELGFRSVVLPVVPDHCSTRPVDLSFPHVDIESLPASKYHRHTNYFEYAKRITSIGLLQILHPSCLTWSNNIAITFQSLVCRWKIRNKLVSLSCSPSSIIDQFLHKLEHCSKPKNTNQNHTAPSIAPCTYTKSAGSFAALKTPYSIIKIEIYMPLFPTNTPPETHFSHFENKTTAETAHPEKLQPIYAYKKAENNVHLVSQTLPAEFCII